MCGIVGYIGESQAAPILLDGLSKLEYRGYDSAGIAVYNGTEIEVVKSKGRLKVLSEMTHGGSMMPGTLGIGHTRWATHGEPSDTNAHPHFNKDESIVVVHNGIIENYLKLKKLADNKTIFYLDYNEVLDDENGALKADSTYGKCVYTYPDKTFRLYPCVVGNTEHWDRICKHRVPAERIINLLKDTFALADNRSCSVVIF